MAQASRMLLMSQTQESRYSRSHNLEPYRRWAVRRALCGTQLPVVRWVWRGEQLLHRQGNQGIRYYDIVAPDALLNRLATDTGHALVATKLSALLCQSLWPAIKNPLSKRRASSLSSSAIVRLPWLPAVGFDQDCRLALFLVHCAFVPAASLPAPPAEVQAAIEPAASK